MLSGLVEDDIALLVDQQDIPFLQGCRLPENLVQQIRFNINNQIADILQRVIVFNDSGLYQHRIARCLRAVLSRAGPDRAAFGPFHRAIPHLLPHIGEGHRRIVLVQQPVFAVKAEGGDHRVIDQQIVDLLLAVIGQHKIRLLQRLLDGRLRNGRIRDG
ncbi:hypothetical protein D3C80_1619230 [compost metagenome]